MREIRFTWDPKKATANVAKHGISFEEARSVFFDEHAVEFYDDEHSEWEDRFLLLGMSSRLRLLMVCHCFRESDGVVRIVSTRKATQRESAHYRRK
ncbi:MAG: BrnT family toxin [Candidatus Hydrogenedentes bacterium]|nr:BrnT family toxin [Candidatus Hydrogenedentota bacterium]